MKVLITGANGFIGYHLIQACLRKNYTVYAGIREGADVNHLKGLPITFVNLEYTNVPALRQTFLKFAFDYVIHAAGITKANTQDEYNAVNAGYTQNLLEALEGISLKRFCLVSSLAALGPQGYTANNAISENQVPNPVTRYGISKQLGEALVLKNTTLPWTIIRPTGVYGPREKDFLVLIQTLQYHLETYIGANPQKLTFVYVEDLVNAILLSLEKKDAVHKTFIISDGNVYDKYAFSKIASNILGKKTVKFHLPLPLVKFIAKIAETVSTKTPVLNQDKIAELIAESWEVDITPAQIYLGYQPQYNLQKGLEKTIAWYQNNKWI